MATPIWLLSKFTDHAGGAEPSRQDAGVQKTFPSIRTTCRRCCTRVDDDGELRRLRGELLRRVEAHPVRTWSPRLLTAMIAILDLVWTESPPEPGHRVRFRIVR